MGPQGPLLQALMNSVRALRSHDESVPPGSMMKHLVTASLYDHNLFFLNSLAGHTSISSLRAGTSHVKIMCH